MLNSLFLSPLAARVWHERWRGVVGWLTGVTALIAIQVSVYPTIRDSREGWSDLTKQFPEAFQKIFRMEDYTSPTGYLSTELFSFMIPLIFIGLATTWAARAGAEEEEQGTADILLSLPVSRSAILSTRLISTAGVIVLISSVTSVFLFIGTEVVDMKVGLVQTINASYSCGVLALVFGSVSAIASAWSGRRGVGLGTGLGVAIAAFVLYSLAPLVPAFDALLPFNPYQWTIGQSPLDDGLDTSSTLIAVGVSVLLSLLALQLYKQHDITS